MVTVIVPVYNTEAYLAECLDSLVSQALAELEILCVDDGSIDGSAAIMAEYAAADPRVRVISQANAGQGAARNRALDMARGEFVTFCDSDDTVPPDAYATMLSTLRETGSDFVIGAARRFHGSTVQGLSFPEAHQHELRGTNLEDFPLAIRDIIACNRLIRRDFWDTRVGRFPVGQAYEDHVPMLMCTALAERFDVLTSVTYNWRNREDGTSTSQQKQTLRNLQDRIDAVEDAREALWAACPETIQQTWLSRVLDMDLPMFLAFALVNDDEYRAALARTFRWALDLIDERGMREVRHARRVMAWLAAQERWDDVGDALVHFHHLRIPPEASVQGPVLVATDQLPFAADLPAELRPLAPMESALQASVAWVGIEDGHLLVHGAAVVAGLDMSRPPAADTVAVSLVGEGRTLDARVTPRPDPELDGWVGHHHTSYTHAGFAAAFDLAELAAGDTWRVHVQVSEGTFTRSGEVNLVQPHSAAQAYDTSTDLGQGWSVRVDTAHGLVLGHTRRLPSLKETVLSRGPEVLDVALDEGQLVLVVRGTMDGHDLRLTSAGRDLVPTRVETVGPDTRICFPTVWGPAQGSALPLGTGVWDLRPRLHVGDALGRRVPFSQFDGECRILVGQQPGTHRSLRLQVPRPLADETRSPVGDQRTRAAVLAAPEAPRDGILFWTAQANAPSEAWWSLDAAVQGQRPDLPRYWGVHDLSVAVPAGAHAVVIGSREWYELLGSCRWVVGDLQAPDWARKGEHQRWWHLDLDLYDAPVAAAALAARGVTPHRQESVARHEARLWDGLLTSNPTALDLAVADHRWTGRAEALGDPRADDLVLPARAAAARTALREQLGIDPQAPVLLYLPERRVRHSDGLARRTTGGELPLVKLAEGLGPEWTVLRHGAKWRSLNPSPQLREVSRFRRLTQVMAAADVAIVERTEARFLWPLTGRPCVVHVPGGLDDRLVRPPVPLTDSLPGPLVGSLAEALAQVQDLPALMGRCDALAGPFLERWQPHADGTVAERIIDRVLNS